MKKKLVLIGGFLAALVLVAAVFGFIFLGSIVKAGVESVGPMVTKVPVKVGTATLSVFSGSGALNNFELGNPEGFKSPHAMKVGSVAVAISPGSLFSDKVVVRSINVQAPEITYEQALGGNNLSKILANVQSLAGTNTTTEPAAPGKKLQVDEFVVSGGRIAVAATMLGGKGATLPLPEIRLSQLGQSADGITPAELVEKALGAITAGTIKAVTEGASELAKQGFTLGKEATGATVDAAKDAGSKATDAAKKLGTGIGDMLKKK